LDPSAGFNPLCELVPCEDNNISIQNEAPPGDHNCAHTLGKNDCKEYNKIEDDIERGKKETGEINIQHEPTTPCKDRENNVIVQKEENDVNGIEINDVMDGKIQDICQIGDDILGDHEEEEEEMYVEHGPALEDIPNTNIIVQANISGNEKGLAICVSNEDPPKETAEAGFVRTNKDVSDNGEGIDKHIMDNLNNETAEADFRQISNNYVSGNGEGADNNILDNVNGHPANGTGVIGIGQISKDDARLYTGSSELSFHDILTSEVLYLI
jgi:hypothetical protein